MDSENTAHKTYPTTTELLHLPSEIGLQPSNRCTSGHTVPPSAIEARHAAIMAIRCKSLQENAREGFRPATIQTLRNGGRYWIRLKTSLGMLTFEPGEGSFLSQSTRDGFRDTSSQP